MVLHRKNRIEKEVYKKNVEQKSNNYVKTQITAQKKSMKLILNYLNYCRHKKYIDLMKIGKR